MSTVAVEALWDENSKSVTAGYEFFTACRCEFISVGLPISSKKKVSLSSFLLLKKLRPKEFSALLRGRQQKTTPSVLIPWILLGEGNVY